MFVPIRRAVLFNTVAKYVKQKKYSTSAISQVEDEAKNTMEAVYPSIEDLSYKSKQKKKMQAWYDQIKALETVEEKLFKINMPRYYGFLSCCLNEYIVPYNSLSHAQYYTRTHIMKEPGLPAYYNNVISNEQLDNTVQAIKSNIEENIVFEYCIRRREHELEPNTLGENVTDITRERNIENILSKALIQKINRTMLIHLSSKYPHLLHSETDFEPRLEASWFMGGTDPPAHVRKFKKYVLRQEKLADELVDIPVQYIGQPALHLRHKHPLKEIISRSECENPALDVPIFTYSPKTLNYRFQRRHLTNIPGFWPGDQNEFGLLSYHTCPYLLHRPKEFNDTSIALTGQAVLASYSWLLSQACYQGFTTFNDITYPLVTQTVITNGQWWSFFVYQLNTILLHSEHSIENPLRNICWVTEPMKLYDTIENEKVLGLNEEVLKTLVKFYANAPEERIGVNMKPYLGKSVKLIADIEHDERRNWLEQQYKHLVCNRPRHRRIPEIYQWQDIYIRKFKTRPLDKKREPWEFGINQLKRRLDEHHPRYIPKCLRANPKKKKIGKWANTYYP